MSNWVWYLDEHAGVSVYSTTSEHVSFPASNLVGRQRANPWLTATAPGEPVTVILDLGSSKAVHWVGLAGIIPNTAKTSPTLDVSHAATAGGAYTAWVSGASLTGKRDVIVSAASQSDRYWKLVLTYGTAQFGAGWVAVGSAAGVDMLRETGADNARETFYKTAEFESADGTMFSDNLSLYPSHRWSFSISSGDDADRLRYLRGIQGGRSFLMTNEDAEAVEVLVTSRSLTSTKRAPGVHGVSFQLRSQP